MIVDQLGRVLMQSSAYQKTLTRTLNLDHLVMHIDQNHLQWAAIKANYGAGVEIDVASPEASFALISHLPDVTAPQIAREFGLESRVEYFCRSNREREEALRRSTGGASDSPLKGGLEEEMAVMGI
jgi:hypothetical protein